MNKIEMFDNALKLKAPKSKTNIPVYAHICGYAAVLSGRTQADLFRGNDVWLDAMIKTYENLGVDPDVVFPMNPKDVTFIEQMKVKIPGRELAENELFQFIEEEVMKQEDYNTIINKGFAAWQMPFVASIQTPPMKQNALTSMAVTIKFIKAGMGCAKNRKYWEKQRGIPMMFHTGMGTPFDTFSMSRGLENFFFDVYDEPDLVERASKIATPEMIKTTFRSAKPGDRVAIFAMRSSATFISPDMFEKLSWPYLKQIMMALIEKGITPVLHADGNWLPMLPFFKELPNGKCIIELDGDTDIEKAYEILHGHQCIRGDVPASLFAFGSTEDMKTYCNKLLSLAMNGGIIIGNGCEIPLNTKKENLQIFLNCTK
jgi:uroporphyrinogen decarboxylase